MPMLPRLERVSDTEGEHSDDSAGEKEAKRQRSEPTTPVSTSGRLPYEYDAVMGITKVGTKEAEGLDEDFDAAEYHDAAEEPIRKDGISTLGEPKISNLITLNFWDLYKKALRQHRDHLYYPCT